MAHLANQRPWGLELDVSQKTTGKKAWQQAHNYPNVGYSFHYFRMDPNKPLGDSYSIIIYYGKELLKTKRSALTYRFGIGPGYIEKRFDSQTNYKNNLISSRINYTLNGRINYSFKINSSLNFNTGIGLIHFSNGSFKVPNLGINIPTIHVGFGFQPSSPNAMVRDSLPPFKREFQYNFFIAAGSKKTYPVNGPAYFVSTISFYCNKIMNRKSGLSLGTDIFYDRSFKQTLDTIATSSKNIKYFRLGITAGHEFFINKLSLITQFGFYLYDPLRLNKIVYQRFALKYSVNKNLFAIMGLKTHFGNAEFVEWGVGIKF